VSLLTTSSLPTGKPAGLVDGGVDLLLIETIFDVLNAKAAIFAVHSLFDELGIEVPLIISGTISDASGRLLSGQTVEAFWNSVRHAKPLAVGLIARSAATQLRQYNRGSVECGGYIRIRLPERGLPNAFGEYDETAAETAGILRDFASSGLLNIVGGCCGTTPDHIRLMSEGLSKFPRRAIPVIAPNAACRVSSLSNIDADTLFVNVGERTNVTGSAKFRKLIEANDYNAALDVARQQVVSGAQVIDVNMDEGMLDSEAAMVRFLNLIAAEPDIARVPIMIDSSKWTVIEAGSSVCKARRW